MKTPDDLISELVKFGFMYPPQSVKLSGVVRFPGITKGKDNVAGWLWMSSDGLLATYNCWTRLGPNILWSMRKLSAKEKEQARREWEEHRAAEEVERAEKQAATAKYALNYVSNCYPADTDNAYVARKKISDPSGALEDDTGALVIPIINSENKVTSYQRVFFDKGKDKFEKRFCSGGQKKDCYMIVQGNPKTAKYIFICEGWATGKSFIELQKFFKLYSDNSAVIAAIDSGNLVSVARLVVTKLNKSALDYTIIADDDRITQGNPGQTAAKAAQETIHTLIGEKPEIKSPEWSLLRHDDKTGTDMNDLWVKFKEELVE